MSKKNKKKLKKILRAKALEKTHARPIINYDETPRLSDQPSELKKEIKSEQQNQENDSVKKEVKKILITMALIILVIVATYFINQKTDWISKVGKYLTILLNINL